MPNGPSNSASAEPRLARQTVADAQKAHRTQLGPQSQACERLRANDLAGQPCTHSPLAHTQRHSALGPIAQARPHRCARRRSSSPHGSGWNCRPAPRSPRGSGLFLPGRTRSIVPWRYATPRFRRTACCRTGARIATRASCAAPAPPLPGAPRPRRFRSSATARPDRARARGRTAPASKRISISLDQRAVIRQRLWSRARRRPHSLHGAW